MTPAMHDRMESEYEALEVETLHLDKLIDAFEDLRSSRILSVAQAAAGWCEQSEKLRVRRAQIIERKHALRKLLGI